LKLDNYRRLKLEQLLKENSFYKLSEYKFYNLFEILAADYGFILYQCASDESKKI